MPALKNAAKEETPGLQARDYIPLLLSTATLFKITYVLND